MINRRVARQWRGMIGPSCAEVVELVDTLP